MNLYINSFYILLSSSMYPGNTIELFKIIHALKEKVIILIFFRLFKFAMNEPRNNRSPRKRLFFCQFILHRISPPITI